MNLKKKLFYPLLAIILLTTCTTLLAKEYSLKTNIFSIGKTITVSQNETVNSILSFGSNIGIAGKVLGNVFAIGGQIVLGPSAKVDGKIFSLGTKIIKSPQAIIGGETKEVFMPEIIVTLSETGSKVLFKAILVAQIFSALLVFLGILALGIAIGLIFPKRVGWTAAAIERDPIKAFLWGVLWIVLLLPITFLLLISIVGIPLILVQIALYGIAVILGIIAVAQIIGKKLLASMKRYNQPIIAEIVWGIVILTLITFIPIVGIIIDSLLIAIAIGASWTSRLGEY